MSGDFETALQQAWKTLILEPRFPAAQHTLGLVNVQLGNLEDAIVELQNGSVCSGQHPAARASLAAACALAGQREESRRILDELTESSRVRYISPYCLATVYLALNERDEALQFLERAFEDRDVWMVWLALDPRFVSLRNEARFRALVSALMNS
jgi:serine/threonine-protein kinase